MTLPRKPCEEDILDSHVLSLFAISPLIWNRDAVTKVEGGAAIMEESGGSIKNEDKNHMPRMTRGIWVSDGPARAPYL